MDFTPGVTNAFLPLREMHFLKSQISARQPYWDWRYRCMHGLSTIDDCVSYYGGGTHGEFWVEALVVEGVSDLRTENTGLFSGVHSSPELSFSYASLW